MSYSVIMVILIEQHTIGSVAGANTMQWKVHWQQKRSDALCAKLGDHGAKPAENTLELFKAKNRQSKTMN